ncbi:hypothetical protein TB2_034127 [Malus domestica]
MFMPRVDDRGKADRATRGVRFEGEGEGNSAKGRVGEGGIRIGETPEPPTPPFSGKTSPQNHHHSLHSTQDTQAKTFHCAMALATVHQLLLRDSPLLTLREKVAAAAVGKKKVFYCLCDCLCPSNH